MPVTRAQLRRLIHAIALGRTAAAPERPLPPRSPIRELKRRMARWWEPGNVVGLCVARKVEGGKVRRVTVQVLVRRKRPERAIARRERIPKELEAHEVGIDVPVVTDVRAVGEGRLESLDTRTRPALGGFNLGGRRTGSGTLACTLRARSTGARLGLSCGHVVARFGQAAPGEAVLVPSFQSARASRLPIAPLGKLVTVLPIGFGEGDAVRNVDAATFEPDSDGDLDDRIAILNRVPAGTRSSPRLDLPVQKVGSTTERTTGVVQALHLLVALPYPKPGGGSGDAPFADLIGVSRFTEAGDSGALVLDLEGAAVGLHLGSFDAMSVCVPIQRVLDAVDCELVATT